MGILDRIGRLECFVGSPSSQKILVIIVFEVVCVPGSHIGKVRGLSKVKEDWGIILSRDLLNHSKQIFRSAILDMFVPTVVT